MQISFLAPHLKLKGGIRRILELGAGITEKGHDLTLYHSDGSDCKWMKSGVIIKSLKEFEERSHDIVVYFDRENYQDVLDAKANQVYYYCCALYNRSSLLRPYFLLFFIDKRAYVIKKALNNKKHKIIINCGDAHDWIKKNMGIDSKVVLGGVNQKMFYPTPKKKNNSRIKLLCLGGARTWKGTEKIKEAVSLAYAKDKRITLEELTGKGLAQDKLAEEYSSADIFVDAQYYAGWNNPIAEAMACKTPVICTDLGANREIAIHNQTAFVVPESDVLRLSEAILQLAQDEDMRTRLAEDAYTHISKFTWEKATNDLVNILESE